MNYWACINNIDISSMIPWRKKNSFTIGLMKNFLIGILRNYNVRKEVKKIYKEKIEIESKIRKIFF